MQNTDIEEIAAVMRDYAFALEKLGGNYNGNSDAALHLTKLAQEQRHRRRFWGFLGRIF